MKRKRIWLAAVELSLIYVLGGCGRCECGPPKWLPNRENLKLVEVGMTKAEVLEIMGAPGETAAYKDSEWLVYQTDYGNRIVGRSSTRTKHYNEWHTVLLIRDGKLAGTDRNYSENRYKYRIIR